MTQDDKNVVHVRSDQRVRDEEAIAKEFPDREEFPGNDVEVDETAEEAPNETHPH